MEVLKNSPYWWDDRKPKFDSNRPWPPRVDVLIIGAGYTGLTTALELTKSNLKVCVVDHHTPGLGASSRNGGITTGHLRSSYRKLKKVYGKQKAGLFINEAIEARNDLYNFINSENLDCNHSLNGRFVGATSLRAFESQKHEAEALFKDLGIETELISSVDVNNYINSKKYSGGVFQKNVGLIHPSKLVSEILRLVLKSGALVYDSAGVQNIERRKNDFKVSTERGTIIANNVVVGTNGYTDKGLPWLRQRLIPVISEMVATEKIGESKLKNLIPKLYGYGETLQLGHYFRPSPDGTRILIGGRKTNLKSEPITRKLFEGLIDIFPALKNTKITHHWYGYVAFPMNQMPNISCHNGIIYAAGYCGSGTVWARWMGKKAAEKVLDKEASSSFDNMSLYRVPMKKGSPWFLPIVMKYYALKDKILNFPILFDFK